VHVFGCPAGARASGSLIKGGYAFLSTTFGNKAAIDKKEAGKRSFLF
jgi:hypothetical protein